MNSRHKKNKIGELSQVVTLILILASAIAILLFVTKFVTRSTMSESVSACRLSVMTQAATSFGIITKTSPLDINCDKRYVNFYNTKVELGLSLENMNTVPIIYDDHKVKKFAELNEFIVDQVLAEELRVCKFQFGDGKVKIFPNDKAGIFNDKNVCFVCTEINFKPGVPKQEFNNLVDYTKKTTFSEQGTNYFNYLTEETVFNESMWEQAAYVNANPTYKLSIESSEEYSIVVRKYSYAPGRILGSIFPGFEWLKYDAKDSIGIAIVQTKNLNKYCDLQAS